MYDFLLEIGHTIMRNGLSLSALGTALYVLLKQRKVKRIIRRHLPWLMRDDADVVNYEARQIRIEQDVRAIKAHLGVSECAESSDLLISTERHSSKSSQVDGSSARYVNAPMHRGLITILRGNREMKKKLLSRKFILALATGVLVILNDGLDFGLDTDTIMYVVGIVATWIIGEAAVDAKRKPEVSAYDAKNLDSVRSDSEGA